MLAGLSGRAKHLLGAPMRAPASRLRATRPSSSGPEASPGPAVPRPTTTTAADTHREINLTRVGIVATLIAALLSIATVAVRLFGQRAVATWPHLLTGLVFLLIVAPPQPASPHDLASLSALRRLPEELDGLLREPRRRCTVAFAAFCERRTGPPLDLQQELRRLSRLHRDIGAWFRTQAVRHPIADHVDALFVDLVYRRQARRSFRRSKELDQWPASRHLDEEDLVSAYRWLVSLFDVSVSSFERKRYANLSHAPNKAMNLTSYIGLMGRSCR